jgi:hypothetical protein
MENIFILLLFPLALMNSRRAYAASYSSLSSSPSSLLSSSPSCITNCCFNCTPDNCDACYKLTPGCQCLDSLPDRLRDGITRKAGAKDSAKLVRDKSKQRNTRDKNKYRKSAIRLKTLQVALIGTIILISDK